MVTEQVIVAIGIVMAFFIFFGGGINAGTIIVGSILVFTVIVISSKPTLTRVLVSKPNDTMSETTHSTKEKNIDGTHTTIEEKIVTTKITKENLDVV